MIFDAFERTVALRYLRARRGERFISITAVMSLLGIALGVAALIIVMSVMNGFRQDLAERIIGLNGHLTVQPVRGRALENYVALANRIARLPGVQQVIPAVEGRCGLGAWHCACRPAEPSTGCRALAAGQPCSVRRW